MIAPEFHSEAYAATSTFTRRTLLRGGAAASGVLAAASLVSTPAWAGPIADCGLARESADGGLAAWVVVHPEQRAEIQLARLDRRGRFLRQEAELMLSAESLGAVGSAWGQMQQACARAETLAREAAAKAWSVPVRRCRIEGRRVLDDGGGRALDYLCWAEIA